MVRRREEVRGDVGDAEDDDAAVGLLDLAAEVAGDLVGRDRLEPGLDHGVAGRHVSGGARHGVRVVVEGAGDCGLLSCAHDLHRLALPGIGTEYVDHQRPLVRGGARR